MQLNKLLTFNRAHDFGVNSIDAKVLSDNKILMVSGGDNQQISVILTDLKDNKIQKFYGHSSSIKGVTLSATSNPLHYQIASSSYD